MSAASKKVPASTLLFHRSDIGANTVPPNDLGVEAPYQLAGEDRRAAGQKGFKDREADGDCIVEAPPEFKWNLVLPAPFKQRRVVSRIRDGRFHKPRVFTLVLKDVAEIAPVDPVQH